MDFIIINNRRVATANISTIDVVKVGVIGNNHEVVLSMNNSQKIQAFTGSKLECENYLDRLDAAIGCIVKTVEDAKVALVDVIKEPVVEVVADVVKSAPKKRATKKKAE